MNREKKLLKNTLIISIGKICTSLITFLLLPLYTNILSPSEYGIVDLFNTLLSLLFPIVSFQIEKALFRELLETEDFNKKKELITTAFSTTIIQIVVFVIISLILSIFIKNEYKFYLIINVSAFILLSLLQQIARGLKNTNLYTLSSFISAFLIIIFNIIFLVLLKMGIRGMLLGTFLGYMISFIFLFLKLHIMKFINIKLFSILVLKKFLKYSVPLIPNALSWWVFSASDRVIVSGILGIDQNGILSASLKFSTVYITLYNIFDISWTESATLAVKDKDFDIYFNKMLNVFAKVFLSIGLIIIVCMPVVFPLMINENYSGGYKYIPISIIASYLNVLVGLISVIYLAKKNTKGIANTSIIAAIINIISHILLINKIGLYAATVSTLISFLILTIYRFVDIRKKYFTINIEKKFVISALIVTSFVCACYYFNNICMNCISMLVVIVYSCLLNKNSVKSFLDLFYKKMKEAR